MQIIHPDSKRVVDDYDFTFSHGIVVPVRIDLERGDSIEFIEGGVNIKIVSKPSLNEPGRMIPAEEVTLFSQHLISIHHRQTEVTELSPEQRFEWSEMVKQYSGKDTVN
jgi:hypothetical protein